jgi:hypothetical protein
VRKRDSKEKKKNLCLVFSLIKPIGQNYKKPKSEERSNTPPSVISILLYLLFYKIIYHETPIIHTINFDAFYFLFHRQYTC